MLQAGQLVLESGEVFLGDVLADQEADYFGEVVFTTGMTGYVESLTDPSFAGQILTFTYPLMGNYGVPDPASFESKKIHARGVILAGVATHFAHHEAKMSLLDFLRAQNVPVLLNVDTRALTQVLRNQGVAKGAIQVRGAPSPKAFPRIEDEHLVKEVSRTTVDTYGNGPLKIIAVDCGMKENIVRHLKSFPEFTVKCVPFDYDFSAESFDGLFLSNGPGDPERCIETINALRKVLDRGKPIFGICLGTQILGLAIGAKTYKLAFGHRGQNQPCLEVASGRAFLTSQNHGYAVDEKTLPAGWQVSFRHLNDDTVAGIAHESEPYFAVQFHPESAPGPHDTAFLFETFLRRVNERA